MDFRIDWVNVSAFLVGSAVGFHLLNKSKKKEHAVLLVLKSILVGVGVAVGGEIVGAFFRLIVQSDERLLGLLALFILIGFVTLKFIRRKSSAKKK